MFLGVFTESSRKTFEFVALHANTYATKNSGECKLKEQVYDVSFSHLHGEKLRQIQKGSTCLKGKMIRMYFTLELWVISFVLVLLKH